jgi:hypothetical protein
MEGRIFLAANEAGIHRAECGLGGEWVVEHPLSGREVTCLASGLANPRRIYAGTRDGVLRSEDGGRSWESSGMEGQIVKSLAVSPHDPDLLYAGTKPAWMFISRDGGGSWAELEGFRRIPNRWWWFSPAEPPDRRPYVIAIALSPTDREVLLAGVEFGAVVRSADGGETWSRHRSGALRDCHSLKFHARDGDWVYEAGGTGGGAAYSQDGGETFLKAKAGLEVNYGVVCAADPEDPELWYVCVASSPFKAFGSDSQAYLYRRKGKQGWQPVGWADHPLPATPTALLTRRGAPGELVAGLASGEVWQSSDYGDNWSKLPFRFPGIWFSLLVFTEGERMKGDERQDC